jgi:hypothetical protein
MDHPAAGMSWSLIAVFSILLASLWIIFEETIAMRVITGLTALAGASTASAAAIAPVDLAWYPPNATAINNLDSVLKSSGVYGFVYNSSTNPKNVPYGTYNWCNMPHVRKTEYVKPSKEYKLKYVEIVSRQL